MASRSNPPDPCAHLKLHPWFYQKCDPSAGPSRHIHKSLLIPRRWGELSHQQRWRLYPALEKTHVPMGSNQWKFGLRGARAAAAQDLR